MKYSRQDMLKYLTKKGQISNILEGKTRKDSEGMIGCLQVFKLCKQTIDPNFNMGSRCGVSHGQSVGQPTRDVQEIQHNCCFWQLSIYSPLFWKKILHFPLGKLMSVLYSVLLVLIGLGFLLSIPKVSMSSRPDQPDHSDRFRKGYLTQSGPMKIRPWDFCGTVGKVKLSFYQGLELLVAILSLHLVS